MKRILLAMLVVIGLAAGGCSSKSSTSSGGDSGGDKDRPTVAFVTNGVAGFWLVAEAGVKQAAEDFDCEAMVRMPASEPLVADQKRMLEEVVTLGVDGVAVSPIDPDNQNDVLNMVAENADLITHDSDAPKSKRLAYVGMSNYDAGRMAAQLVREAIPDGGKIMIFVGRLEQLNARQRRQGLIDELMGREPDPERYDDPGATPKNDKYEILGTRTDNFDTAAAKAQADDALSAHPDLACMVGLFEYNPPAMLEALKTADKVGEVKLVGFDENPQTLLAVLDGACYGTVVQNPYMYGYESVRILAGLARGDKSVLPENGFLDIPARQIRKDNATEFIRELERLTGQEILKGEATSP